MKCRKSKAQFKVIRYELRKKIDKKEPCGTSDTIWMYNATVALKEKYNKD